MYLHSRIRDEIVKGTRQTQGWHEEGRKGEASRGQGFSGRGRARHGNKTRRTLISDSENREHEPCHTAHGSSSLSLSLSRSVVSRGPHGARNTACRIQLETRGDGMHQGRDERSRRETIRNIRASLECQLVECLTLDPSLHRRSLPLLPSSSSRAHIVIGRGFLSSRFLSDPHDKPQIFARILVTRIYRYRFSFFFA